ncbi:hypothetical protein DFH07DRAFT_983873 [Mycena maculata]|uniref:Uncharacterized protein n=1 Tax=Mycena maculata TaxID=230809 RepID=A0AAD7MZH6_9AGAR|nr:hypothetical protein DFH07DRAFT_983873 [Mycena maculata]
MEHEFSELRELIRSVAKVDEIDMTSEGKDESIQDIVDGFLFPRIVARCIEKRRICLSQWAGRDPGCLGEDIGGKQLDGIAAEHRTECIRLLKLVCSKDGAVMDKIAAAHTFKAEYEGFSLPYSPRVYIRKLGRYFTAARNLIRCLLEPNKGEQAKDAWASTRANRVLFLHAELQLAMFYCMNPDLHPVAGYVAGLKGCFSLCNFVLQSVLIPIFQSQSRLTTISAGSNTGQIYSTGLPMRFSVRHESGGGDWQHWRFPDPTILCTSSLPPSDQNKPEARLDLIRLELRMSSGKK